MSSPHAWCGDLSHLQLSGDLRGRYVIFPLILREWMLHVSLTSARYVVVSRWKTQLLLKATTDAFQNNGIAAVLGSAALLLVRVHIDCRSKSGSQQPANQAGKLTSSVALPIFRNKGHLKTKWNLLRISRHDSTDWGGRCAPVINVSPKSTQPSLIPTEQWAIVRSLCWPAWRNYSDFSKLKIKAVLRILGQTLP